MTDTKTLNRPTSDEKPTDQQPAEPKPRRLDLSATQLAGGALAAMTAAVIGARVGVAGTVFGAAIASLVAGVAGSLYTASLKHTKDKIQSVIIGRVGDTEVEIATVADQTTERQSWDWDTTAPQAAVALPSADPVATSADLDRLGRPTSGLPWKAILVSTAAVFLLAIAGITGFELISGQSVSGGDGTTITQVSEGRTGGSDVPSQTPSSGTSTEPTAEPSDDTSTSPSTEPSVGSTQTSEPSAEPSQTAAPSASSDPTASAAPTGAEATGDAGDAAGG